MADTTPTGSEPSKPRRTKAAPPAEQAATPEETATAAQETAQDAGAPVGEAAAGEWLRYEGQAPLVFMDLGGEIVPGQVVHPRDAVLRASLLARGDFEPAEPPAPDSAGSPQ